MNFCEFIAFSIVQQHDQAVLITELGQGFVESLLLLDALVVINRIIGTG